MFAHAREIKKALRKSCDHFMPCNCHLLKKTGKKDKKILFLNAWNNNFPDSPVPVSEFMFHPTRRWRFDYAWPSQKIAVEIEGAVFIPGNGHSSGSGITKDIEKYNAAVLLGWRVLRFTTTMLRQNANDCANAAFILLDSK